MQPTLKNTCLLMKWWSHSRKGHQWNSTSRASPSPGASRFGYWQECLGMYINSKCCKCRSCGLWGSSQCSKFKLHIYNIYMFLIMTNVCVNQIFKTSEFYVNNTVVQEFLRATVVPIVEAIGSPAGRRMSDRCQIRETVCPWSLWWCGLASVWMLTWQRP